MDRAELIAAAIADSHRPDLEDEMPRFLREAEGMIRRTLQAYEVTTTLTEDERVSAGLYELPSTLLNVREIFTGDTPPLIQVSLAAIRGRSSSGAVLEYAVRGQRVEFRGVPATDAELELVYVGWPEPLVDDSDTNDLLEQHEVIYKSAMLHSIFAANTQDLELADAQLEVFNNAVELLNQANGRKQGGATVTGAYNLFGDGGAR
jgi:hypothetical protein